MHICFIGEIATAKVETGGIGSFVANIIPELLNIDCSISVISFKKQQHPLEIEACNGFNIYWINTHQWGALRILKRLLDTNRLINKLNKEKKIDVIEAPEPGLLMTKKIKNILYVIRLNGGHLFFGHSTADTPINKKSSFIERDSLRRAGAVIGVSKYVFDTTVGYYKWLSNLPHKIIPNAIVTERFYASKVENMVAGKILFYGSLTEKKGVRQLIEAIPAVTAKFPKVALHVYGRDIAMRPSGDSYKAVLLELINRLGLTNVHIHNALPNYEMPAVIESAQMVVLPSHMEAMPLAWLEAMAMAKPFIGSTTGPGPEVIKPGVNGLLCNPFDVSDIAEKIMYLLENEAAALAMGLQARKDILQHYNSKHLAKLNKQFYEHCINLKQG